MPLVPEGTGGIFFDFLLTELEENVQRMDGKKLNFFLERGKYWTFFR